MQSSIPPVATSVGQGTKAPRPAPLGAWIAWLPALGFIVFIGRTFVYELRAASVPFFPTRAAHPPLSLPLDRASPVAFDIGGQTMIRGTYTESRNGAAIILTHGTGSDSSDLVDRARILSSHGYGVLMLDWPGHGASDGRVTWNAPERFALERAVDYCLARPGIQANHVGLVGFSFGSYVACQVAAHDTRIGAVVLEGAFPRLSDLVRAQSGLHAWLTTSASLWVYRHYGMDPDHEQPIDVVREIAPRSLLVIAGTEDHAVPPSLSSQLYAVAAAPKELWVVRGAHHGDYSQAAPREYPDRIVRFFDHALLHL